MKIVAITAQILIAVTFLWLGLSRGLHLVTSLPPRCTAQRFIAATLLSRHIVLFLALQLLGSLLLMVGRWKVIAFVLLGPIALNIVLFHLFMGRDSLIFALLLALLESLVIWTCRRLFRSELALISDGHV
jgi:putative oxidoreductase